MGRAPAYAGARFDSMRLASVSRAFSGAVALSLAADGTLTLDDAVGKWLPGLPSAWSEVTLRELLNHTSGIPDFSQTEAFGTALMKSPLTAPPPRVLLSYAGRGLNFTPGSRYKYSNSDNIIVGRDSRGRHREILRKRVGRTSVPPPGSHGHEPSARRGHASHTGNTPGYTQFVAASANGRRSAVVSVNSQITPTANPARFTELRHLHPCRRRGTRPVADCSPARGLPATIRPPHEEPG